MNSKIFFSDLDGTILNDKKELTPDTYNAVINWMNSGNYLALSSGRPLESIKEVIEKQNLLHDNLYAIGFNGSLIFHPKTGEKLTNKTLSVSDMKVIADIAKNSGVFCQAYDDTHILVPYESDELHFYRRTVHVPFRVIENFPDGVMPSCKMLCIAVNSGDTLSNLASKLTEALPDSITCLKSNDNLLEVFSNTAGKGQAVIELCNILNVDIKDSLAAGDEQNDISMIQAAGTGIAMLNARDIVKENADVITKTDNNNDGLLPFFNC